MHRHIGIGNDVWIGYEAVIFSGVSNVLEMKSAKSCNLLEQGVDADHIIRFAFDSADNLSLIDENLIQIAIHPHHVSIFFVVYTTILLVKSCKIVS